MSIYPSTVNNFNTFEYVTLSNLVAGDFVVLVKTGAHSFKIDKAVIDPYSLVFGFVRDVYTMGSTVAVYPINYFINDKLSGLIPGDIYYSHPSIPGAITNVSPTGTLVIQELGVALNTTDLDTQYSNLFIGTGTGGGGGGTTTNVLVDGGTFMVPFDNTLIDAGAF